MSRSSVPATGELVVGRIVDVSMFPMGDDAVGMTFVDVTEVRSAEEKLQRLVDHDSLTELWNRRRFRLELAAHLASGDELLVAMLDLNGFKGVNDTLGHAGGDELLIAIGARLRSAAPEHWRMARLGGDEFAVVSLQGQIAIGPPPTPARFAARIAEIVQQPTEVSGMRIRPSTSIGIASAPQDSTDVRELLCLADDALYDAKRNHSQFTICDPARRMATDQRQQYYASIAEGFGSGEFITYLQPIVDLATMDIAGAEALSRWARSGSGVLLPAEFLQVLLLSGHLRALTDVMIAQACELMTSTRFVSVNLGGSDLYRPDLVGDVRDLAGDRSLEQLWFELAVGDMPDDGDEIIAALGNAGAQIAIDDFGTTFSSLRRFADLDASVLKLDRSALAPATRSATCFALLRGVVQSALALGTTVVGEGIETEAELATAQRLGCNLGQGFMLGRPAPADMVAEAFTAQGAFESTSWPSIEHIRRYEDDLLARR